MTGRVEVQYFVVKDPGPLNTLMQGSQRVAQDSFRVGQEVVVLSPCQHVFDRAMLARRLQEGQTCPGCYKLIGLEDLYVEPASEGLAGLAGSDPLARKLVEQRRRVKGWPPASNKEMAQQALKAALIVFAIAVGICYNFFGSGKDS